MGAWKTLYAGSMGDGIKITAVEVLRGHMLLVTFSSGEQSLFDATKLQGSAFEPLKDDRIFNDISLYHGVITWANGEIDIAPEAVYMESWTYDKDVV